MVKTAIITGFGINSDLELVEAFKMAGSDEVSRIHINDLIENPTLLRSYHIIGFPGGFSFGDHLGSGLVFAHLFRQHLKEELDRFIADGKLIIGICNGFQVLVKMGVLPNTRGDWTQEVSLIHNDTGVFIDKWITVKTTPESPCIWTRGLGSFDLPIRHGEGRFITDSPEVRQMLSDRKLRALTYEGTNPNGSEDGIAGITDNTGQILGLMPHPEVFIRPETHPRVKRSEITQGAGLEIFRNGVNYIKEQI